MSRPLDLAVLAELLWYDSETGLFSRLCGAPIGTRHSKGYVSIKLHGYEALAHRLAWYMTHGETPAGIDHINRVKHDNRIANLRPATSSENQCNRGVQSNNTSGVTGVARNRHDTAWQAYIKLAGKRKHLGTFQDFDEAVAVRKAAEAAMFGRFAPDAHVKG
jgi:hypothetical protein